MRSVRRVGEAGTHPTSTDHVSGPIQTASNGETVGKNQVNLLYISELTLEQEYGIQLSQDRATASPKLIQERELPREREMLIYHYIECPY